MIDTKLLKKRCHQHGDTFEGELIETPDGPYIFIDNGADILAVAHLDSVLQPLFFLEQCGFISSPVLDDRLGAHIILDVLPTLGLKYDILLTSGEEYCRSTALHFEPPRQYKWMFEFDRRGTDVVMYHYENGETVAAVESVGAEVGVGSYTDLVDLEHLGVSGFNWGCAYDLEHTYACYVDLELCEYMIGLFVEFYHEYKNTMFEYTFEESQPYRGQGGWGGLEAYWDKDWILKECEWCGSPNYLIPTDVDGMPARLCEDCIEYWNRYKEEEKVPWAKEM